MTHLNSSPVSIASQIANYTLPHPQTTLTNLQILHDAIHHSCPNATNTLDNIQYLIELIQALTYLNQQYTQR